MTLLSPQDVQRPNTARDPGVRSSATPIRDPRADATRDFARSMSEVSTAFKALAKAKEGVEDDAFVDNYAIEFNQRAGQTVQAQLDSDATMNPNFVDLLDESLAKVQEETFTALEERGYTASEEGRRRAESYAMDRRISEARSGSVEAHNQRVNLLYDDAEKTAGNIARAAWADGDLATAYERVDTLYERISKIASPDKARAFRDASRVLVTLQAIEGHIARNEFQQAKAIIDRETGFASESASQAHLSVIKASQDGGVDPALMLAIGQVESGFDADARPIDPETGEPLSSAAGVFQITDATAQSLGLPPGAGINDQARAAVALTRSNMSILRRRLGAEPSPAEVYMAHVLGADRAGAVLEADGDAPITDFLPADVIVANPQFAGMKVSDLYGWAKRKMQDGYKATESALDGRKIAVDVAGIPLSKIPSMSRVASQAQRERANVLKTSIQDDIASIKMTGTPVEGINPDEVEELLGKAGLDEWRLARQDAGTYWESTQDMESLTNDEIQDRIDALDPEGGSGFLRRFALQEDVRAEGERVMDEREAGKQGAFIDRINDDVASIRATGEGAGIDEAEARDRLTDEQFRVWQQLREDAKVYYENVGDAEVTTTEDLVSRVRALDPGSGEGYIRRAELQDDVREAANRITKQREEDPAQSVTNHPLVQAATEGMGEKSQADGWQDLIGARLAAQSAIGVPDELQRPLTKDELKRLSRPIQNAPENEWPARFEQIVVDFDATYGPHSDAALTQFMEEFVTNREQAAIANRIIRSVVANRPVSAEDAAALDAMEETQRIRDAASSFQSSRQYGPPISMIPTPFGGAVPTYNPFGRKPPPALEVPDQQDIEDVLALPEELLPQFIETFGVGQVPRELRYKIPQDLRVTDGR